MMPHEMPGTQVYHSLHYGACQQHSFRLASPGLAQASPAPPRLQESCFQSETAAMVNSSLMPLSHSAAPRREAREPNPV